MNYELTYNQPAALEAMAQTQQLKWWSFDQNNSGGYWEVDDNVSQWVHIQEWSASEAVSKLNALTSHHSYCECCGERWNDWVDEDDGNPEPMCYGKTLEVFEEDEYSRWFQEPTGKHRLHFFDGRIASYKIVPTEQIK
ncbi:MAG: DUF7296 family protein [Halobacteriota archaeon]